MDAGEKLCKGGDGEYWSRKANECQKKKKDNETKMKAKHNGNETSEGESEHRSREVNEVK